jgi:hypothetical protein
MRARRLLLNEKMSQTDPFLEVAVRGMGVPLPIEASPFPALWADFRNTPDEFLKVARLVGVLWLYLSGVVEHVLRLDLKLNSGAALDVNFEGQRRRRFANADPAVISAKGICKLDDVLEARK